MRGAAGADRAKWIDVSDPQTGQRRLDNASDFVRIESGEAPGRGIPVVSVLLDGAALPQAHQLPDDLKELCDRQAEFVEYHSFDADVERLIKKLRLGAGPVTPRPVATIAGSKSMLRFSMTRRMAAFCPATARASGSRITLVLYQVHGNVWKWCADTRTIEATALNILLSSRVA